MNDHLWGIILAGGNGERLRPFIKAQLGQDKPKQYCAFTGTRSMIRHTIDRAKRLIPTDKLFTIVNEHHASLAKEELKDIPLDAILIHPYNRETAPGILHPLLRIFRKDCDANVVLMPSDHFVLNENRFLEHVEKAFRFVEMNPEKIILLGVVPDRPETSYGWIEIGEVFGKIGRGRIYRVRKFWEKPNALKAKELYRNKCLWNTLILIGKVGTLLSMFEIFAPRMVDSFSELVPTLGTSAESQVLKRIFRHLPTVNFSKNILSQITHQLCVLPLKGIYWNDWGEAERIRWDLKYKNEFLNSNSISDNNRLAS